MRTPLLIALVFASCVATYFWWRDLHEQLAHDPDTRGILASESWSPGGHDAPESLPVVTSTVPRGSDLAAAQPTSPHGPTALMQFKNVPFSKIRSALPMPALDAAVVEVDGRQMVSLFEGKSTFTLPLLGDARIRIKPETIYASPGIDARVLTGQILQEVDDSPAGEVFFTERDGTITGEIRGVCGSFALMNGPEGQYLIARAPGGDRSDL